MSDSTPKNTPPEVNSFDTEQRMPTQTPPEEVVAEEMAELKPTEMPPQTEEEIAGGTIAAGVWYTSKKIAALWSINQNRNSWISVSTLGWKKLANNSDSAVVALTMLAAHARDRQCFVNLREESGQIKEMYIW